MTAARQETDILLPEPTQLKLEDGILVQVRPLKARQFFKLLRIVTRGGAHMLGNLKMSALEDPEDFAAQIVALIVFAVPEAEDEAFEFFRAMVAPVNEEDRAALDMVFLDPSLDDVVSIIEAVINAEKEDLAALGKRLTALFKVAEKTGQLKATNSSAHTPAPSTSSPQSTDGATTKSSTAPSAESDKPLKPFPSASTMKTGAPAPT